MTDVEKNMQLIMAQTDVRFYKQAWLRAAKGMTHDMFTKALHESKDADLLRKFTGET